MTDHPPLPSRDAIRDWVEDNPDRFDPDGDLDVFVDAVHQAVANKHIGRAVRTARLIRKVTIGTSYFDPVYPFHGAYRPCPHCDQVYRVHGGHADHRDRCPENPINKDNPERVTDGGRPQVEACPECDGTDFQTRRPGHPSSNLPADAPRYRCYDCDAAFDEPVERPGERPGLVGAAKVLDELDADDVATDGGERPPPPDVAVGDRVTICMQADGDAEYVEGVVATVHNPRTIDAVYRRESRVGFDGSGAFERNDHIDEYSLQTSLVYMAESHGWLKGWDDA